jgi:EamA-like transporter family
MQEQTRMLALNLGLTAALIWAVHDLMARKLSQGAALLPIVLLVLVSGSAVLLAPSLVFGDWRSLSVYAVLLSCAAGLAFTLAIGALYRAFSMAPARIVSPIIGAYPILSLAIAVAQSRPVTIADWLAVAAVVGGIAIVSLTESDEADSDRPPRARHGLVVPQRLWVCRDLCHRAGSRARGIRVAHHSCHPADRRLRHWCAVLVDAVIVVIIARELGGPCDHGRV